VPAVISPAKRRAFCSKLVRRGSWEIPERSSWRSLFGTIGLDLRAARLAGPAVELDIFNLFGTVTAGSPLDRSERERGERRGTGEGRHHAVEMGGRGEFPHLLAHQHHHADIRHQEEPGPQVVGQAGVGGLALWMLSYVRAKSPRAHGHMPVPSARLKRRSFGLTAARTRTSRLTNRSTFSWSYRRGVGSL
jgi:hypothetical protein